MDMVAGAWLWQTGAGFHGQHHQKICEATSQFQASLNFRAVCTKEARFAHLYPVVYPFAVRTQPAVCPACSAGRPAALHKSLLGWLRFLTPHESAVNPVIACFLAS